MELAAKVREQELSQFFTICKELRDAEQRDTLSADVSIIMLLDEIEVMAAHTTQAPLRERCQAILSKYSDPSAERRVCRSKSS